MKDPANSSPRWPAPAPPPSLATDARRGRLAGSADPRKRPLSRQAQALVAELRGEPPPPYRGFANPTHDLATVLTKLVGQFRFQGSGIEQRIAEHWAWVVGPTAAQRCKPEAITEAGTALLILAASSLVAQELRFQRAAILRRLRDLSGCEGIQELRIRTG